MMSAGYKFSVWTSTRRWPPPPLVHRSLTPSPSVWTS